MVYPRIHRIETIGDRILRVEFTNQDIKDYDISPLLEKPMFAPLKQPAFSETLKLSPAGTVWFGMKTLISMNTSFGKMARFQD
jgi:hypothetical protein